MENIPPTMTPEEKEYMQLINECTTLKTKLSELVYDVERDRAKLSELLKRLSEHNSLNRRMKREINSLLKKYKN